MLQHPSQCVSVQSVQEIIGVTHEGDAPLSAFVLSRLGLGSPTTAFQPSTDLLSLAPFLSVTLCLNGALLTRAADLAWRLCQAVQVPEGSTAAAVIVDQLDQKINLITSATPLAGILRSQHAGV